MVILEPSGLALGQSEDGLRLIGSAADIVRRAAPPTRVAADLGLSPAGAGAAAALPRWIESLPWLDPSTSALPSVRRVTARLDYGDPFSLTLRVEHDTALDLERLRSAVERWFGAPAAGAAFAPRADWGGERAVMARARMTPESPAAAVLSTTWQRSELDRACRSLATWLGHLL